MVGVGEEITSERFPPGDHHRFIERCREGLATLGRMLDRPGFGEGPASIGAELEIGLVDAAAQPAPVNADVLAAAGDRDVDLELDRFNLEINSAPVPLAGRPMEALGDDLAAGLADVARAAATAGARPVAVGILPTLRLSDLGPGGMSDSPRFRALSDGLLGLRGEPFHIDIDGDEPLRMEWDDITLEGAATGLHVHLRVPPAAFAAAFNAAQTAVAPVLAAASNSPLLLGHLLWHETRVALFGQAIDDRAPIGDAWLPSRASFGHGWIGGPLEPFAESVALHVPLLPTSATRTPPRSWPRATSRASTSCACTTGRSGAGTGPSSIRADDPHLRIEMRALPAGPTLIDMRANIAFLVGLTIALAPQMDWMARSMPFEFARGNFYAAARDGLDAVLLWPSSEAPSPRPWPGPPSWSAASSRRRAPGSPGAASRRRGRRAARGARGAGARGDRRRLAAAGARVPRARARRQALAAMTEAYMDRAADGAPVHEWDLPG